MAEYSSFTSYRIIPELKLIITYFKGIISLNELIQNNKQFLSDKQYDASYDMLMDFRDAYGLGNKLDIQNYFNFFKNNVSLPKRVHVGMLYQTGNLKFLFSIYKPIAKIMKIDAESFKDIDDYFNWMNYEEEAQLRIREEINSFIHPKSQRT